MRHTHGIADFGCLFFPFELGKYIINVTTTRLSDGDEFLNNFNPVDIFDGHHVFPGLRTG
jgi:hypothetical protein